MKGRRRQRIASALLALAMFGDEVMGDLEEELAIRARTQSTLRIHLWYWSQVVRSIPAVVLQRCHRDGWFLTCAVAIVAILAQGAVEWTVRITVSGLMATSHVRLLLSWLLGIGSLAGLGYLAASVRPSASILLALIAFTAGGVVGFFKDDALSWFRISVHVVGPISAVVGGALRVRHGPDNSTER